MESNLKLNGKTQEQVEELFLGMLDADPLPVESLLEIVEWTVERGRAAQVESLAELLQERLLEAGDGFGMLRLLELRARVADDERKFRALAAAAMTRVLGAREGTALVGAAELSGALPLAESFRRLDTLMRLAPGVLCHDKTWGFGVVGRVDHFYAKVAIDFDKKPGHGMSLAYAAETLELVSDDHLLARRHRDPDGMAALVASDPGEVVRTALRSYGSLSAPDLQELLVPDMVAEDDWKTFWDTARKDLKADPLVDLPSRRNEPIRLLAQEKQYGAEWFDAFRQERDVETILARIEELEAAVDIESLDAAQREALAERLAFVVKAAGARRAGLRARAIMAAARLGVEGEGLRIAPATAELGEPDAVLSAAAVLPAREIGRLLAHLAAHDRARTEQVLLDTLTRLPVSALGEAMTLLVEGGREVEAAERLRVVMAAREAGPQILLWVCRNVERVRAWGIASDYDILAQVVAALEASCSGETLRAQNQLRALFEKRAWLSEMLKVLGPGQRADLLSAVQASTGWDAGGRRSVMARMIKLYPELARAVASERAPRRAPADARLTSWRTLNERRAQYRKLVEQEIPANSKEIGVARSYGDLRENFEYQAARDHQRLLLRRKEDLERDLQAVRGTDFAGIPTDRAGRGTQVTIERPDGRQERYCILGEWDRDPELGIIASESRLAGLLNGAAPGEAVDLPPSGPAGGEGAAPESCRVVEVGPLPPAVKAWIGSQPTAEP